MTTEGSMLFNLYDKIEANDAEIGSIKHQLEDGRIRGYTRWRLKKRLAKLRKRQEFYQRCVVIAKRRAGVEDEG